jgi:hypothetical protein
VGAGWWSGRRLWGLLDGGVGWWDAGVCVGVLVGFCVLAVWPVWLCGLRWGCFGGFILLSIGRSVYFMGRFKVFCLALMSVFVVGVMTASAASAESTPLPDLHTALSGELYPLDLQGEVKTAGKTIELSNVSGDLAANFVSILLHLQELSSLGTALVLFKAVEEPVSGESCKTAGQEAGVVAVPEPIWHIVYTSLSPTHTLETGTLILFPKFEITCGALITTTIAPNMGRLSEIPGNSGNEGDSTMIETATHCSNAANGIQEISSYFEDSLAETTLQLLKASISGTASSNSCEEIPGTPLLTVESTGRATMFSVLL